MKLFLSILSVIGLAVASAHAQYDTYVVQYCSNLVFTNVTSSGKITNGVTTVSTNLVLSALSGDGIVLDVRKQDNIWVTVNARNTAANLANLKLHFAPSIDNIWYDRSTAAELTVRPESVVTNVYLPGMFVYSTNLTTKGMGYLKLIGIDNVDTNGIPTNMVIRWAIKR